MPVDPALGGGAVRWSERAVVAGEGADRDQVLKRAAVSQENRISVGPPGGMMMLAAWLGWRCEERG
jgi:hypothetical protein